MAGITHTTDPTPEDEGTERFTFGLILGVVKVLEDHGYPQFNGPDVVELQWSPAVMAGDHPGARCASGADERAAMEPGRDGRDHVGLDRHQPGRELAAMEPAVMAGTTPSADGLDGGGVAAAMEPGRDGRDHQGRSGGSCSMVDAPQWSPAVMAGTTRPSPTTSPTSSPCRNGARP